MHSAEKMRDLRIPAHHAKPCLCVCVWLFVCATSGALPCTMCLQGDGRDREHHAEEGCGAGAAGRGARHRRAAEVGLVGLIRGVGLPLLWKFVHLNQNILHQTS